MMVRGGIGRTGGLGVGHGHEVLGDVEEEVGGALEALGVRGGEVRPRGRGFAARSTPPSTGLRGGERGGWFNSRFELPPPHQLRSDL